MEAEINSIPKEMEDVEKKGVTEVDNKEQVEGELTQVQTEIQKLDLASARMVKLENDFQALGLLDSTADGQDKELNQMSASLMKVVTKNQDVIKKMGESAWIKKPDFKWEDLEAIQI